jgi:hypothetical protein
MDDLTPIGVTNWRNQNIPFGIKDAARLNHIYCIGKSGVGKTTLLQNMAISDIRRGNGLCVIDPHGDLSQSLLNYIPKERVDDVIYFDAGDFEHPIAFNPLDDPSSERHLVLSGLISTFKKIWADSWGPRMEYILRYALLSLLYYPNATLLHIQPLLTDYDFRREVLSYVKEKSVLNFWFLEFDKYPPQLKAEAISPILNKAGVFAAIKPLRNIIGHAKSSFSIDEVMNKGKVLICNLSKGMIGEDASTLLASMIINQIQVAALGRIKYPECQRINYYLYVDEMHNYVNESISGILSESRKFKLSLFLTHQYIGQLDEAISAAIFGNVGTIISFRVGAEDAGYLAKEFYPVFSEQDLVNLPKYSIYLKLMIDGMTSKPFSATTLPSERPDKSYKQEVINSSRTLYAKPREILEGDTQMRQVGSEGNRVSTLFNL